jgi:hypothetical protein
MPVNLIPFYILLLVLLVLWGAFGFFLFRWRRLAGVLFIAFSVVALLIHITNGHVERRLDEQMAFRPLQAGDYSLLELMTSRGDRVIAGSPELGLRLRGWTNQTVRVSMIGWYSYGRLQAYHVESIEGVTQ